MNVTTSTLMNAVPTVRVVGFASDEGVRRNDGRPGAQDGPSAIRRALRELSPDLESQRFRELHESIRDEGDFEGTAQLEVCQDRLGGEVARWLRSGDFVIVLGGGQETSYATFLGHVQAGHRVDILSLDAHPDVRPVDARGSTSGTVFRQALEHPGHACRRYRVLGIQPYSAARAHLDYIESRGGEWSFKSATTEEVIARSMTELEGPAMVALDLDAVDQAFAPGVSSPCPTGFHPDTWLRAAYLAGRSPAVRSVDLVELSPRLDRDGQTARLAALTVWHVLRGLADR